MQKQDGQLYTSNTEKLKVIGKYYALYLLSSLITGILAALLLPVEVLIKVAIVAFIALMVFMIAHFIITLVRENGLKNATPYGVIVSSVMGLLLSSLIKTLLIASGDSQGFVIGLLIAIFFVAVVIFTSTLTIGFKVKRSLESWYMPLIISLLIFCIVSIIAIIVTESLLVIASLSAIGLVLFSLINVVEANMVAHSDLTEESASWVAINLYLNFCNMLIDLIRLVFSLVSDLLGGVANNL